ncbi:MAG: hypothetical protein IZT60_00020 [Gammaproteobacteria bacterium]|nr:hypothetical protein [Gammaproteobacteria bacterium]
MKKCVSGNRVLSGIMVALLSLMTPLTSNAADTYNSDDWEYNASIYMWMPGMKGETNSGADFDIDFGTLLDNLKMTFMGAFEARNGDWSLFTDVIYLNLGGSKSGSVTGDGPFGLHRGRDINIGLKNWIITLAGGYNIVDSEKSRLDIIAGTRYFYIDLDLGLKIDVGPVRIFDRSVSVSDHVWDAIIGVKGHVNIDANWYLPYYFDIGAGGSDLTLQAMAGVGYKFDWGDVLLTYRYLHYDYDSDFPLANLDVSGPLLGAKFRF